MKSQIIIISSTTVVEGEAAIINRLFKSGIHRYHINKEEATEQSIAEILEGVEPKYLGQISLHSHFHLVLAYGVGGIHYTAANRKAVGDDYSSKVNLYQGFGVKVSTSIISHDEEWKPADYALIQSSNQGSKENVFPVIDSFEPFSTTRIGTVTISDKLTIDKIIQRLKAK